MAPESVPGRIRSNDWAGGLDRMVARQHEHADREAMEAWREFVVKFRRSDFDVLVGKGTQKERFVSWDALDQFIRR